MFVLSFLARRLAQGAVIIFLVSLLIFRCFGSCRAIPCGSWPAAWRPKP